MTFQKHLWGLLGSFLYLSCGLAPGDVVINEIMYHQKETEWKEDTSAEYLELVHVGDEPLSLQGWKFSAGVKYTFPNLTVSPGDYVVVAAQPDVFKQRYPNVKHVLGPFRGRLSNGGERLELEDAEGDRVDEVVYADSGRWAKRVSAKLKGYDDWVWQAAHDGAGYSLALKSPKANNEHGVNWTSSLAVGGTPGAQNDVYEEAVPPVIVSVSHEPAIPRANEEVTVTAEVDHAEEVVLSLRYRIDGTDTFRAVPMVNGTGRLPAMADESIVQFYVHAEDANGLSADYPPLNVDAAGQPLERQAVCLYQVDDSFDLESEQAPGAKPTYRVITTASELAMMKRLAGMSGRQNVYNNHLHLTFIAVDGVEVDVRYNVTARIRGHGSRSAFPPGIRVSFPSDDTWRGVADINLNTQFTQSQSIGASIHQLVGASAAAASTPVRVLLNGDNWAKQGSPQFGCYVHNEVLDGEFVSNHYPGEEDGNLYRLVANAYLNENRSNMSRIRQIYSKRNHGSKDDYSDLFTLIETLRQTEPKATYFERVNEIADLQQWADYIALDALLCNTEGGMPDGRGDDVAIFRRKDGRFQFVPYDLDSILGMGDDGGYPVAQDVFGYGRMAGLRALFQDPRFLKLYTDAIVRHTETTYRPEIIHRLIEEQWRGWIPDRSIDKVKDFVVARIANVLSQIQSSNMVATTLEEEGEFYKASSEKFALYGKYDSRSVTDVEVGRMKPKVFPETGMWILGPERVVDLVRPGMNQLPVIMRDDSGDVVASELLRVWLDNGEVKRVSGILEGSGTVTWTAEEGPYLLEGKVVVPDGLKLVIGPGTTVYGSRKGMIEVVGDFAIEGNEYERVTFAKDPSSDEDGGWLGLRLASRQDEPFQIQYADFMDLDGPIEVTAQSLEMREVTMSGGPAMGVKGINAFVSMLECDLKQIGEEAVPLIDVDGGLIVQRTSLARESSGLAIKQVGDELAEVFASTFRQADAPVVVMEGRAFVDGCDFIGGKGGAKVIGGSERLVSSRNRSSGEGSLAAVNGNVSGVSSFPERSIKLADVRFVSQPPPRIGVGKARFEIAGDALQAFKYAVDDGPWSERLAVEPGGVYALDLEFGEGTHVVRLIGHHISGRWSDDDSAVRSNVIEVVSGLPSVVLSEVLAINESAHKIDGEYVDYVELKNVGQGEIDLSGYGLSDDPDKLAELKIAKGTKLGPGAFLVLPITKDESGFALSGSGDAVYLSKGDRVIDEVNFGLQLADQPVSRLPDGTWALSTPTPGASNETVALADAQRLSFSEWLAIPDRRSPDEFLEVHNPAKAPVDLGGMTITDRIPNKRVWKPLPPLNFVAAGGRQVFLADGSPKDGADHLDFRLSNEGEAIGLFTPEKQLVDFVIYKPQKAGVSQGRDEDGSIVFGTPSPGKAASADEGEGVAGAIMISEVHYHPAKEEEEEFLELVNMSDAEVSLDGLQFSTGIELEFAEIALPAKGRGVVVKDRKTFRKRYGREPLILGEFKGKLSNGGERVSLTTSSGDTVVEFEYNDKWHKSTDGKGRSLTLKSLSTQQLGEKKAWKPSEVIGGTPGV